MNSDKEQNSVLDQGENIKKETPQQNELNLDFSEMEPITPKKVVEPKVGLIGRFQLWLQQRAQKKQQRVAMKNARKSQAVNSDVSEKKTLSPEQDEPVQTANTVEEKKKSRLLSVLPVRHRRLAITLIAIVAILLIFFWLKPKQSPVDSLQNGNVPITYQPLDQSNTTDTSDIPWLTQSGDNSSSLNSAGNQSADQTGNPVPVTSNTTAEKNSDGYTIIRDNAPQSQDVATQSVATQSSESKNEQAEAARALAILNGGSVPENNNVAPVVATPQQNVSRDNTSNVTTNYKTLVISSGKSLMQVFRDNHLNISDVVAMNKTRGAKALSRFKPGDKVQVSVKNGRVSELRLPDGSRFIRNADGSYRYQ